MNACTLVLIIVCAFAAGVVLGAAITASRTQRRSDAQAAWRRINGK